MILRFFLAIVFLVLIVGGIVGFNMFRDQAIEQYFASAPQPSVTVSTVTVEPAQWTPGIEAIGTVSAARGVDLTVETTGIAQDVLFTANQDVSQGDVLVQLDAAVQSADLAAARTQADLDRQSLERSQELTRRGVGSTANLDAAQAAASASSSQVDRLQAVLDQKQLRAPFKGTIGIPRVESGQYLQPGTVVATLQDLETMRADFSIPEQQLGLLRIGQPVSFRLTNEEREWQGTITGIDPKVDPASRLVSVRAEIRDTDGELSPGQFVQVRVALTPRENVLAVPQTALVSSLYGDFVYVVRPPEAAAASGEPAAAQQPAAEPAAEGGTAPAPQAAAAEGEVAPAPAPQAPALVARQVFVKPGGRQAGLVEIAEGISAGDQVVTAGQNRLSNNSPVAVNNAVQPGAQGVPTPPVTPASGAEAPNTEASAQ